MRIKHLLNRFLSIIVMALVMIGLSACYKDAGDDVEPTSGRVDVNDIAPTVPSTPTPLFTPTLAETTQAETTRTLVPTTTPVNFTPVAPSTDESAGSASVEMDPTPTSMFAPSFTPAVSATPTEPGISTPGMSDIQASPTLRSTTNPAFQPTPTSLPVAQNPCVHVVKPNDTLYSISQENNVTLDALIAANPSMLGGSANTTLQIGWELQLPGCQVPGSEPTAAPGATPGPLTPTTASQEGFPKTHVVQPGETLFAIGRLYGVSPDAIIAANNLANPNLLQPGDTLTIPAP